MKALSVKQPWASYIVSGRKTVECRSWPTKYRGELLICSSKGDRILDNGILAPGGMALGVIELINCRPMFKKDLPASLLPEEWHYDALHGFAWHIRPLYEIIPFPVKGRLSFYNVDDSLIKPRPGAESYV